jgi:hypothetical protein
MLTVAMMDIFLKSYLLLLESCRYVVGLKKRFLEARVISLKFVILERFSQVKFGNCKGVASYESRKYRFEDGQV